MMLTMREFHFNICVLFILFDRVIVVSFKSSWHPDEKQNRTKKSLRNLQEQI